MHAFCAREATLNSLLGKNITDLGQAISLLQLLGVRFSRRRKGARGRHRYGESYGTETSRVEKSNTLLKIEKTALEGAEEQLRGELHCVASSFTIKSPH